MVAGSTTRAFSLGFLTCSINKKITTCPPQVETLIALGESGITDSSFGEGCCLQNLEICNNREVTQFPPTVEKLDARGSVISDISLLDKPLLRELNVSGLTTVMICPMTVVNLIADGASAIDNSGIAHCPFLKTVRAVGNPKITNVPLGCELIKTETQE